MKIPEEELKKGVELCFKNANSFIEDAKKLVGHKSYGHACFLALSAIEEVNKAFIYAMNRIGVWKDEELPRNIYDHKSKFRLFVVSRMSEALDKANREGNIKLNKPLEIADFVKMGQDFDSIVSDLKEAREESLYVDYQQGKWISPFDIPREEAEISIKFAQKEKIKFELFCNNLMDVPIELVRKNNEFMDNQFLPWLQEYFYNNIDGLYKDKVISKEIYEKLKNRKKLLSKTTTNKKRENKK